MNLTTDIMEAYEELRIWTECVLRSREENLPQVTYVLEENRIQARHDLDAAIEAEIAKPARYSDRENSLATQVADIKAVQDLGRDG